MPVTIDWRRGRDDRQQNTLALLLITIKMKFHSEKPAYEGGPLWQGKRLPRDPYAGKLLRIILRFV
jgi:hypothetical protein